MKRVIVIVLDSFGAGELPDSGEFADSGSDTLGHLIKHFGGLDLPNMDKLGLSMINNIHPGKIPPEPEGAFGKMAEVSASKDTVAGHWELMGIPAMFPFPTYPDGFPDGLLEGFRRASGCKGILGNKAASGTEIILELGEEHMKTGFPIVYTSADSVFQIAAHNDVIPLEKLYDICEKTRAILKEPHNIVRVIARPFTGTAGSFERTTDRKDYSIDPPGKTLLDLAYEQDVNVIGVGKIGDIFAHRGVSVEQHTGRNPAGIRQTLKNIVKTPVREELVFVNLVDFDTLYGHRRDPQGYYDALKEFDAAVPEIRRSMKDGDILILTADHGCDPFFSAHTDHTREYVPILICGKSVKKNVDIGTRKSFADCGRTVAEYLGIEGLANGKSFWGEING
ncbi:MAG: phosphopentomutase [bacterium]